MANSIHVISNKTKFGCKLLAVGLIVALCGDNAAYGYDDDVTHAKLTEIAVFQSRLFTDPSLLQSIGLRPFGENQFEDTANISSNIVGLIEAGAVEEDAGTNSVRHFFDPQNDRGLTLGSLEFTASPDWILDDDDEAPSAPSNTYRAARFHYLDALTRADPSGRNQAYARTFKALGHVVHHIQDMGQPQHTRNDIHCNREVCKQLVDETGVSLYRPSFYEGYTAYFAQQQGISSGAIPTTGYPLNPVFREPRDYWINSNFPGTGMAEFVSTYFLTENNHLRYNPARDQLQADSQFPLPNAADWIMITAPCSFVGALGSKEATCDYVQGRVLDPLTGFQQTYIVARKSVLYDRIVKNAVANGTDDSFLSDLFVLDPIVFDSMYPILLPRITAFSAGMIDYFFRGSIDLELNSEGTHWRIRNTGNETLNGRFRLYSDDANGIRTQVTTDGWESRLLTLIPGQSSAFIPFNRPADNNGDFMLVFFGQQGAEGEAGRNDLFSVVARKKHVPPEEESIACGTPIAESGSSEGIDIPVIELGTTPGEVQLEFIAYSIPDAIRLVANNAAGTELIETDFVSGYHLHSFDYNHEVLGTTTVRMTVDGNSNPDTLWNATLGCPGQAIDNGLRPTPLVPVMFVFGGGSDTMTTAGRCSFSLYIDGQFRAPVNTGFSSAGVTLSLAAGMHTYEYVNKSCEPIRQGGPFASEYVDSLGVHPLVNAYYGPGISGEFSVAEP